MAAAARDRKENQSYDDGGGYGKFRKRPYRRRETTPYDRPIRNPGLQSSNGGSKGWLSKFVDPAQRLITSGAHKLFASVFRKRLPPPTQQTQPPEPAEGEGNQKQREALSKDKQVETVPLVSSRLLVSSQGGTSRIHDGPSSSNGSGVTDLESMLKQKKFTRHEIDRLTTLLQSRVVDLPIANEEKSAVVPSKSFLMSGNEKFLSTPAKENEVLDQDVASPAELAKAYMGSRPSKVSPSMLGFPNQSWKDDSTLQASQTFRSKGLSTSAIHQSSGLAGSTDNGFTTPRSRGRSAVYSMARLPYSRTQSTKLIQSAATSTDAFSGREFPSQSVLDKGRFSGTKQGTLKRRSSVLDNDIESSSPIRRIRQKANLMSSAAVSARGTRTNLDAEGQLALTSKPATEDEQPKENGDYSMQISGSTPVSSKSSEMASKILQQLDVMVSSKEKSPAKLSPSMLHGQALRSLEKIDSSKFFGSVQNTKANSRNAGMSDGAQCSMPGMSDDAQCSMPEKEDRMDQNGSSQLYTYGDNVAGKSLETHNPIDAAAATTRIKYADQSSKPKNLGFRISVDDYEDFLDIDDEENAVNTTNKLETGDVKLISSSAQEKAAEPATVDMPPVLSGANPILSAKVSQKDTTTLVVGNSNTLASTTPSSSGVINYTAISSQSAAASDKVPSGIFSYGEKASVRTEQNGSAVKAPLFSAASLSTSANDGFGMKFGASSNPQSESSQRMVTVASMVDPVTKQAKNDEDAGRIEPGDSFKRSEIVPSALPSSPAVGMFSFGSGLQNGTLPGPSTSQTVSDGSLSVVPNGSITTDASVNRVNTGSAKATVSPPGSSVFKFGSPASSNLGSLPSTNAVIGTSQTNTITGSESSTGVHVIDSKSSITSSGSVLFGSAPSIVAGTTTSSLFSDSLASSNKSSFVSQFGSIGAPGSSAGSSIFGSAAASSISNNNNLPGASTEGSLFSAAASASTGNNLFNATASSTSTGSSLFSFSAKPATSSITNQSQDLNNSIGSGPVAGTGLSLSTQSTPSQFGSSVSSLFGSTSTAAAASGSSVFGSSSTTKLFSAGASFGATSSTPSEANIVGSTATTSSSLFGSSWSTPSSSIFSAASNSSASSSGFVFGSSSSTATTTGTSVFGSSTNAASTSPFSFSAPAENAPKQTVFGGTNTSFGFGSTSSFASTPSGNNDQMKMEDSMAEDTVQATTPSVPLFGQTATPPLSSGFVFGSGAPAGGTPQFGSTTQSAGNPQFGSTTPSAGNPQFGSPFPSAGNAQFGSATSTTGNPQFGSTTPSGNLQFGSTFPSAGTPQFGSTTPTVGNPQFGSTAASPGNPFQFGGQPNMAATPQNASPFQASGSVEFNAGGSFSLGTGDKSNRRFVKVRKNPRKK
ncbi:Nuclear pore complex protein NUP1 [Linum perenne]